MDPRDLGECGLLFEIRQEPLEKWFIPEETLADKPFPRRFGCQPFQNEFPVSFSRCFPVPSELSKDPVGEEEFRTVSAAGSEREAGPWIVLGVRDDPRPDRVEHNIPTKLEQVGILLHEDRFEPSLKHVADFPVSAVELLRVDAVELPHSLGKVCVGCFNEEVVVIGHETVRMTNPVVSLDNISELGEKYSMVMIVKEDGTAGRSHARSDDTPLPETGFLVVYS